MSVRVRHRSQKMPKREGKSSRYHDPMSRPAEAAARYAFGSLLYTDPSFLRGMASVFDLGGTLSNFNYSLTPWQADYFALLADHRAIVADANMRTPRLGDFTLKVS